MSKFSTSVIGGAGRIGLPFSIVNALAERKTIVFDTNKELVELIKQGKIPYKENGLEAALKNALASGYLQFGDDPIKMQFSDVIVLTIGTPVDPYLKPDCSSIIEALRPYFPYLNNKHLIVRSTVYPGGIKDIKYNLKKNGIEVSISYAPERALQGDTLQEMKRTPQLVSSEDELSLKYCSDFFADISPSIVELQPEEAELVKLFTNAYRYTHFAIVNQFLQMATDLKCDYKRIESAMRVGYPRLADMPPSGFTAGPCLRKDTLLLASSYPEFTMGKSAFWINENLPNFIVSKLDAAYQLNYKTVGILGLAFKAENDDTRDSLALRLRKLLKVKAKKVLCHDPYVQNEDTVGLQEILEECDIAILATPHDCYRSLSKVAGPKIIDVWNFLERRVGLV